MRWGRGAKALRACWMPEGLAPAARAARAAAHAFSTLWGPRSRNGARSSRTASRPGSRRARAVPETAAQFSECLRGVVEQPAAADGRGLRPDDRVGAVQDGRVLRGLVFKEPHLRAGVGREIRVTVQVVVRDVEQHPHRGPERRDGVELETADFGHNDVGGLPAVDVADQGPADVPADEDPAARGFQHPPQQLGHRGFPVRAAHRHDGLADEPRGQLDLPDHRDPAAARGLERGEGVGHSRAQHDQIRRREIFGAMPPQRQIDVESAQLGHPGAECRFRRHVGRPDGSTAAAQKPCGGDPGARQPDHENLFVRNLHAACHPIVSGPSRLRPCPAEGNLSGPGPKPGGASRAIGASTCSWRGGPEQSQ